MLTGKMSKEEFQKASAVAISNLISANNIQNQLDALTDMFYGYLEARKREVDEEVMVEFYELRQLLIACRKMKEP